MGRNPRENTCRVLEMVDEGLLDRQYMLEAALNYLSDAEVRDMCRANDILFDEEE